MKSLGLTIFYFFLFGPAAFSQAHLSPPDGGLGVPGVLPHSFVITWEGVPGAETYEYVLTDNSQCFAGCAGDTRQNRVAATSALEYNLREDVTYYWITRVHFTNGDSSGWSPISSFIAITPPSSKLLTFFPNPLFSGEEVTLRIDWAAGNNIREIQLEIWDIQGKRIDGGWDFRPTGTVLRIQDFRLNMKELGAGRYVGRFLIFGNGGMREVEIMDLLLMP